MDDPESLEILQALAEVADVGDFRLREFMEQLGLNPNQPALFYRALIKEAREFKSLMDVFEENINTDFKVIAKLKADLSAQDRELKVLKAKISKLEAQTQQKMGNLESERHDLVAATSELQDKVRKYDAITELLKGEIKRTTLKALSELFWDIYTDALHDAIEGRPRPDPALLDDIRQKLRQEFSDILRIPKQELEKEMDTLQAENRELRERYQGLVDMLKRAYRREGGRAH